MYQVKIQITGIVNEDYPIWVEVFLTDINGKEWRFIDKVPIFLVDDIPLTLPLEATMRCTLVKTYFDNTSREVYIITTENPDHLEDEDTRNSEFHVYKEQLIF
jgi:hypothetical protein